MIELIDKHSKIFAVANIALAVAYIFLPYCYLGSPENSNSAVSFLVDSVQMNGRMDVTSTIVELAIFIALTLISSIACLPFHRHKFTLVIPHIVAIVEMSICMWFYTPFMSFYLAVTICFILTMLVLIYYIRQYRYRTYGKPTSDSERMAKLETELNELKQSQKNED